MKTPFPPQPPHLLLAALALLGLAQPAAAQTPATGTTTPITGQPAYIGTEAAWWLANPQALFLQLDIDRDGLLNYNEFNRITVLNTQVIVPGGIGTVTRPQRPPPPRPAAPSPPPQASPRAPDPAAPTRPPQAPRP